MPLNVELVSVDREVWSGEASMVVARTSEGDLGVLPGHTPLLGQLSDGVVQVRATEGEDVVAAVHGGFLSVSDDNVSILAEVAELAADIDVERARSALQRAQSGEGGDEATSAIRRAEARLRAAELR